MNPAPTVRGLLDAGLPTGRRMEHLKELCGLFTDEPLDATVAGLRGVLADRISMEDFRRLHILISHLYHHCGASFTDTAKLRAEVNASLERRGEPTAPASGGR